jgi:hypothetical protein
VLIEGAGKIEHWADPHVLDGSTSDAGDAVHILSPFDPLVIQRKRLKLFFGYEHRFEAYVPKDKRVYGYFALPILLDDEIVAVIDLKADRTKRELLAFSSGPGSARVRPPTSRASKTRCTASRPFSSAPRATEKHSP